jgi:hypothetical protein
MTAAHDGSGSDPVLGQQALIRALLERQLLLRRSKLSSFEALEHPVGVGRRECPDMCDGFFWQRRQGVKFRGCKV